jgi:hypothetical protein
MARLLLAVWYTASLLTPPGACCCAAPPPVADEVATCCRCRPSSTEGKSRPPCRCPHDRPPDQLVRAAELVIDPPSRSNELLCFAPAFTPVSLSPSAVDLPTANARPDVGGGTLRAHSILRC